jgi:DnaK suppressor protein
MATSFPRNGNRTADRRRQEALEDLLRRQRAALQSRTQRLRDGQPSGVMDLEERALDTEEQGVGCSLLELTYQTLQGIETALQRLDAGQFGVCSDCGRTISEARLRALPFALRCLVCQEQHDVGEATARTGMESGGQ